MSPLAAKTVGEPRRGAPRSADAFCDALEYIVCVIPFSSVHLNAFCPSGLLGESFPLRLESKFDVDERLEIEIPDVVGDAPPKRCDREIRDSSFESTFENCGVNERNRETVGCRKGFESFKG